MAVSLKKDQVYRALRRQILSGELKPDEQLAGEFALADRLGVSCVTLRAAMRMLEEESLIYRVPRKGTFVSSLRQNHNYLIIAPNSDLISNPNPYIIQGMEKEAAAGACRLETIPLEFIRSQSPESVSAILERNAVGGIFLMVSNYNGNESEIRFLNRIGIPAIIPHGLPGDRPFFACPMLMTDVRAAFGEGVRHLISQGHHRIATIGMSHKDARRILRGFTSEEYLDFLAREGASPDPSLICHAEYGYASIRDSIVELLQAPFPPTAVMCFSDFFAIHVYRILEECGIRIPEDISVMGFCGYSGGQFMAPPLSTVDFMYEQIGRNAIALMLRSHEWFPYRKDPMTISTPYRLQVRESTAMGRTPIASAAL